MFKFTSNTPGSPPGKFIQPVDPPRRPAIRCHIYNSDGYECVDVPDLATARQQQRTGHMCWIDVRGVPDNSTLGELQELFDVHPLSLEDFFQPAQRPKMEAFDQHLFFLLDQLQGDGAEKISYRRVALFLGDGWVLSLFPEDSDAYLAPIYDRLKTPSAKMRARKADYLTYALIDLVVDHFFPPLEKIGDQLEDLEEEILEKATRESLSHIHGLKVNLLRLRHRVWPMRELINAMIRDESRFIGHDTRVYIRDCYDHIVQIMEINENYREIASGMLDLYISSAGNRTNDIVKVLTIFSVIFIPLTFIAGVYGMNFNTSAGPWNMPELNLPYGYVGCLAGMLMIVLVQLAIFKKKRWF